MICENCGCLLDGVKAYVSMADSDEAHYFCTDCISLFGTCAMCIHTSCEFATNPDPTPQFVVLARQIQQGNATFIEQKEVPNTERITRFCIDGKCNCFFDGEHPLCCRHGGYTTCPNYTEKTQFNFVQDFSMTNANEN